MDLCFMKIFQMLDAMVACTQYKYNINTGLLEYTLPSVRGVSQSQALEKNEDSRVTWNICPQGWVRTQSVIYV